jgi:hypothetical protein
MLSSLNACVIIVKVSVTLFSEICTTFNAQLAVPLLDPLQNCISPDIRLQIKGYKKSACPPNCVKCCTDSQDMLVQSSTVASRGHLNCYSKLYVRMLCHESYAYTLGVNNAEWCNSH